MKITFLGTNGWYDTDCGNTICTLIETKTAYIILDAGNGIHKADRYIKKDLPVYLLLSHFHIDHMEGLHILAKFKFKSLTIMGQTGTKAIIKEFLAPVYSIPVHKLPFPCKVTDVKEGRHSSPFKFLARELVHASRCLGYRLEIDGKVISYCTDTGYCKNSVELSANADLLISECALLSGQTSDSWPHMNPQLAAKLAVESKAKKLALTHFDAALYTTMAKREKAQARARMIFPETFSVYDGLKIDI
ncbi:MAG: MBL fold metallo-hydrolase [Deltaproteobacteria bacterium HGW-Deltaproteobacteria-6]|jgi:ribonuclease BN (tRNA processing enzyme)|nr:MAG: MBL fold metallo-hydrolase [Deltaproteobacteria bacterium HGW-Deltaproteobacteria-6]PKN96581.1 MAG: MBL fold metallo-hydrolase [Chloroflexi bacterium HGW-Chloroflexi-5]